MALARRNEGVPVEFRPMSPEEIERTVQFLLLQQAQFAAEMARNEVRFGELSAKAQQVADGVIGLTAVVGHLAAEQQLTAQQIKDTNAKVADLGDYVKTVGSHLDAVVEMFERHLREEHGRRPS
jgi:hypothetical protein